MRQAGIRTAPRVQIRDFALADDGATLPRAGIYHRRSIRWRVPAMCCVRAAGIIHASVAHPELRDIQNQNQPTGKRFDQLTCRVPARAVVAARPELLERSEVVAGAAAF
jgi:hypothetical protein